MKRSPLKKVSKQSHAKLKRKLWKVFSEYVRKRDKGICFTCGRQAHGSGYHAGHFIAKAVGGITLYFHEENVRGQCYNCNINLGGNSYVFGTKLGNDIVQELYTLKQQITKDFPYAEKIEYYSQKLKELNEKT
jgi:hypothetical protein